MKNLHSIVDQVRNLKTWGARSGVGTFISLEMGELDSTPSKVPHAKVHLWVTNGIWKITTGDTAISSETADRKNIVSLLEGLNGTIVESLTINPANASLQLRLGNGVRLDVVSSATDDEDWMLYVYECVLIAGPGERLQIQQRSKDPRGKPRGI